MSGRKDYYKILELPKTANQEEVKKSYYKLAKKLHPDKNPNDPNAAEKFKVVKEAYENLSDPSKKNIYDATYNAPTYSATPTTQTTSAKTQARYQASSFPQFFPQGGGGTPRTQTANAGPRIFAFNVFGSNVPIEEVLKMFFGGMQDFGQPPSMGRPNRPKPPPNPNAVAACQFCRALFTVPDLINHQYVCPQRPTTDADFQNMFPDDPGPSNQPPADWRRQHQETLDAIRRDRQKANNDNAEYEYYQSGFVECPTCLRRFNMEAASHHIPFCRKKTANEGAPPNPLNKEQSAYKRSREYAENLRKKQNEGGNNNHNYWKEMDLSESDSNVDSGPDDDDILHQYWGLQSPSRLSSRSRRKTALPDLEFYRKLFANRPRRNTSPTVYESTFPSFYSKMQSRGCDECVRVYGLKAANIYCSCGVKRSTNVKF